MAQTKEGAMKCAAKKLSISVEKYLALTKSGLKHCTKCRLWKKQSDFYKDKSRFDGLKAKCKTCADIRIKPISKIEFAQKRKQGIGWCADCQMWHNIADIKEGKCPTHRRAYQRERYKTDAQYRFSRKQNTSKRRRNVDAVPMVGEEVLTSIFEGLCAYCDQPATTFDHLFPVAKGGITERANMVPACRSCNSSKKDRDVFEWLALKNIQPKEELIESLIQAASYFN